MARRGTDNCPTYNISIHILNGICILFLTKPDKRENVESLLFFKIHFLLHLTEHGEKHNSENIVPKKPSGKNSSRPPHNCLSLTSRQYCTSQLCLINNLNVPQSLIVIWTVAQSCLSSTSRQCVVVSRSRLL